jgi:hypothetical protein
LSAGALLSCAKAAPGSTGSGGSNGSGGSHASGGSNGSGGNNSSGGSNGSGGSSSSGGSTATGSGGSSSSGGSTGSGGSSGSGGSVSVSDAGTDASCQTADFKFLPQIPDVYVLVDRSGSEFDQSTCSSTTMSYTGGTFFTLKTAVLQVIQSLQGQVRFGFGSFVGEHPNNGACMPDLTPAPSALPIGLYNYNAINAIYGPLGSLSPCGAKADTPAVEVMPMIQAALLAEPATAVNPMTNASYSVGQKYLLFVTDSEVDFCDDGEPLCPADATTWKIQDLYKNGIGTLIIGLPTTSGSDAIASSVLQNFANAGAGQPVAVPAGTTQLQAHNDCQGVAGWASTWNQANPGQTIGSDLIPVATYSATGGNAKVFAPTSTSDVKALTDQLTMALQGVKSCSFDLSDVNGKSIKVDTTMLAKASVKIQGNPVTQDATNGWSMSGATTLILNGSACDTWRMPSSTDINFAFPCSTIIFE